MNRHIRRVAIFYTLQGIASATIADDVERLADAPPKPPILVTLSLDARHVAMTSPEKGGEVLLLDGKPIAHAAHFQSLYLSNSGEHAAYVVQQNQESKVFLDDKLQGTVPQQPWVVLSGDGTHVAFNTTEGRAETVIIDSVPDSPNGDVHDLNFSADSKHRVYLAEKAKPGADFGKVGYVLDGKEAGPSGAEIGQISFIEGTADLMFVFEVAHDGSTNYVSIAGKVTKLDGTSFQPLVTSDGHWAIIANARRRGPDGNPESFDALVVDGKQEVPEPFNGEQPYLIGLSMSPDGAHIAYAHCDTLGVKKSHVTIMGRNVEGLTATPTVVRDGVAGPHLDELGKITFSPDSNHLAYTGEIDGKWRVYADGVPGEAFDYIRYAAVYSPDSKHLAYAAKSNGMWRLILDGKAVADYTLVMPQTPDAPLDSQYSVDDPPPFRFRSDGTLNFVAIKDGQICRVSMKP